MASKVHVLTIGVRRRRRRRPDRIPAWEPRRLRSCGATSSPSCCHSDDAWRRISSAWGTRGRLRQAGTGSSIIGDISTPGLTHSVSSARSFWSFTISDPSWVSTGRNATAIVQSYADWLSRSTIPKLFIDAEPAGFLIGAQREFCRAWPNQQTIAVAGAHFLQEEAPHEVADATGALRRQGPCGPDRVTGPSHFHSLAGNTFSEAKAHGGSAVYTIEVENCQRAFR